MKLKKHFSIAGFGKYFFLCVLLIFGSGFYTFSQESEIFNEFEFSESLKASKALNGADFYESGELEIKASKGGLAEVPPPKRPKPIDKEKAEAAAKKDETPEVVENNRNIIKYGLPSEIRDLIDELMKEDDPRFTEDIYDLFQITKTSAIREKVLKYFTKLEDPCLEDFAVELLNDPYDEKNDVVSATFQYISAVKTKAAVPAVITLIESENESYFAAAIATLGEIGDASEALFLAEYLDRSDLSDAQRQNLMRTCGKMHAVETWPKLVEVLEDEDENSFVRMYAAEAIGLMKLDKSVPVLIRNFDTTDPNLRQYIIKGLANYPEVVEAKATILQGIRDEHWKVRQESIKSAKEMEIKEAVPYLIHRAKNDTEKVIKDESFVSIAKLNTTEGNDYLVGQLSDKKCSDNTKAKIVEVLLKENNVGEKEILELAKTALEDDKHKSLRYAIGKELVKYARPAYGEVCSIYLASKDANTIGIGLDLYKNGRYEEAKENVLKIAEDKKANSNKTKARKLLGMDEDDDKDKDKDKSK
ncbi:MAG: HEAT repeat domain-containing protein [Treponema sp.]|nr:HEAT repeat domain-containing protein [Treponema sp.]